MKLNLLVLFNIFLMFCCSCSKKNSDILSAQEVTAGYNEFVAEIMSDSSLAKITLQRTQCFGTCPIYCIGIFEDGSVKYFSKSFVDKTGLRSSNISVDTLNALVLFAMKNEYINLNDSYYTKSDTAEDGTVYEIHVSDLPTKISSLIINGEREIVNNYFGGPPWLSTFENRIDSTVNIKKWLGK